MGFLSLAWDVSMILVIILLAVNLAVLLYGSCVFVLPELTAGSLERWPIYTIVPNLAALFFISGPFQITLYFFLIFAALILVYAHLALSDGKNLIRLLSSPLSSIIPRLRAKNRWTMVAQLFLATLFFQWAYIELLRILGIPTPAPTSSEGIWSDLFSLANASVYEEIASRVALIGLPMLIVSIVARMLKIRRRPVTIEDSRETKRYLLGSFRYLYGGNIDRKSSTTVLIGAFVLLLFSSLMFGYAHVDAWGDWKMFPTFVAGLALGYAYLRGGLLAAILLHFATDYMSVTLLLIEQDVAMLCFYAIFVYALIFIGSGYFLYYVIYSINLVRERFFKLAVVASPVDSGAIDSLRGEVQAVPPLLSMTPPIPQRGIFATACANCGWPEAIFIDGRLKCSRCGKER